MSKIFLNASKRDAIGSNRVNKIRKSGLVPASLYGGHMEPVSLSIKKVEIDKFFA